MIKFYSLNSIILFNFNIDLEYLRNSFRIMSQILLMEISIYSNSFHANFLGNLGTDHSLQ